MNTDGGQFTVRGLFALVAACALLAALLRFATVSVTSLVAGFALGLLGALGFVGFCAAIDSIERRSQNRMAKVRHQTTNALPPAPAGPFSAP